MEKAAERARDGDLLYFNQLSDDEIRRLFRLKDADQRSLLHNAVLSGTQELCQILVERGAASTVNEADEEGWNPLHSAASCGHTAIVDLLLQLGADVGATNSGGRTPLHYAAGKGKAAAIRALLGGGAPVNAPDMTGVTPLHRAAGAGRLEAVKVLMEQGQAALDAQDKTGATPLFLAVQSDQASVAFYLAARGAGLEVSTKDGQTPLSIAGENAPALKQAATQGMEMEP